MKKAPKKKRAKEAASGEVSTSTPDEKDKKLKVSEKERKKLTAEAIAEIRQGVSKIGVQKAGAPFVPWDWSEKYKPVLGPYKQFLKDHSDEFVLVTEKNGDFIIRIGYGSKGAGSLAPSSSAAAGIHWVSPPAEGLAWLWEQAMANPMPLALLGLFAFQMVQQFFSKGSTADMKVFLNIKIGDDEAEKAQEFGNCSGSCDCCHRTSILKVGIELYAKSYPKTAELLSSKLVFGCSVILVESQEFPRSLHWREGRGCSSRAKAIVANWRCTSCHLYPNCQGKGKSEKPLTFKGHVGHSNFLCTSLAVPWSGSAFHRIIPGFMCQGGVPAPVHTLHRMVLTAHTETYGESESETKDFTRGNGTGGECDPCSLGL
eukprot:Skav223121  [mRNA]  locus=scaffold419:817722:822072:- [translate_table: standard]